MSEADDPPGAGQGTVITISIRNTSRAAFTIANGQLTGGVWLGRPPVPGVTLTTGSVSFTNAGQSALEQVGGYISLIPAGGGTVSLSWNWSPGQPLLAYGNVFRTSALLLTYTVTGVSTLHPAIAYVISDPGSAGGGG